MRKIVNFRAPLFIAIGFIFGIFSYYEFLFGDIWFGLITLVVLSAIGVLLFVIKSKPRLGMVAVIIAVIIGFFFSHLNYHLLTKDEVTDCNTIITGRVCDIYRNGSGSSAYYLEDCVDSDGVKYGGRIETYIFDGNYNTGDILTVRGTIHSVYPIKTSPETYYLRQNIRYKMDTEIVITRAEGELKLDEIVRKYIYDVSSEFAPRNGDVFYALLTGDRSAIDRGILEDFKFAGIIHLLAVSGLHIGFIVAVIGFVLKKFKLHPLVECVILLVPLVFYAYICNFTPSVIRAIVMVCCTYVAKAAFGKYDLLTSLSFAVIVLLLISPFNLFDLGFQLSVLSVYGIATVYSSVDRLIKKSKIPKIIQKPINMLAVSLSCSLATFFTLQLNYGYAPIFGILLNVIAIPLVSVVFVIGWIGMSPWIFHYVLFVVDWILEAVVVSAKWIANLSFATVAVPAIAVSVLVIVVWLFVLGGFVNLRKRGKIIANSVLACLLVLCIGLSFVKTNPHNQLYVAYGYNDTMCVVTSDDGQSVIVGNFSDAYAYGLAAKHVSKYKTDSCILYITDYGECNTDIVEKALKNLPVKTVYKLDFSYNASIDGVFADYGIKAIQQMQNTSTGYGITVTSVYDGGLRAAIMRTGNLEVSCVYGDDYAVANYLSFGTTSDVYVLPNANKAYADNNLVTLSYYQSRLPLNYGANKYGTFTITQKGDTISIKFR